MESVWRNLELNLLTIISPPLHKGLVLIVKSVSTKGLEIHCYCGVLEHKKK
jgi:hypothetical protein